MRLLIEAKGPQLPLDYLLVRVRQRRAALRRGECRPFSAEAAWLYHRLSPRARQQLGPLFIQAALRPLIIALRHRFGSDMRGAAATLHDSLLDPVLQKLLLQPGEGTTLLRRLEESLAGEHPWLQGIAESWREQGVAGVEAQLQGASLVAGAASRWRPVRRFCVALIDARNLMALAKHFAAALLNPPRFFAGGEIAPRQLQRLWQRRDAAALLALVGGAPDADPAPQQLEAVLRNRLSTRLQREGEDPLRLELILDYLWRCRLQASA